MNKDFQKINIEDVFFFDSEIVRANSTLELDTIEYNLYAKKTRNRDKDEYLPHDELVKNYEDRAALVRTFNRVVTIGVGFIKKDKAFVKALKGTEEEIIREFCELTTNFKYVCGFNSNNFDLPMIVGNGMKYFNIVDVLPDQFNPSGKKPWNLDKCIDLMDIFKGTHYAFTSLDELCYHFGIETPKDDIDGSQVSKVYYEEGEERIIKYVKKDVFANINIFRKMQGKEIYESFEDRDEVEVPVTPVLERIYTSKEISDKDKEDLRKLVLVKKPNDEEIEVIRDMVLNLYIQSKMFEADTKAVVEEKTNEVNELIEEICKKK